MSKSPWETIKEYETLADFGCDLPGIGDTPLGQLQYHRMMAQEMGRGDRKRELSAANAELWEVLT